MYGFSTFLESCISSLEIPSKAYKRILCNLVIVYLFDFTISKNSLILLQELAAFLIENSSPSETSGILAISSIDIFLNV